MADAHDTAVQATLVQQLSARIDNLEVRIAYQDDVIEQLNKVIVAHWSRFDQLHALIDRLDGRLRDAQDNARHDPYDEPPPPHY